MMNKRNGILACFVLGFILCLNFEIIGKPGGLKPGSGSEELITSFLNAVNSGNRAHMGAFISENFSANVLNLAPLSMVVSLNMEFYYQTGGLGYELIQVNSSDSNTVSADLYNKLTESYVNLQIPVADTTTLTINWFIKTEPVNAREGFEPPGKISEKEMLAKVNYSLNKLKNDDVFSGVVLIARNGEPILNEAVGEASKSYQIKNKIDTKFNIASVGKIFTGLAVTQLAEQEKLSYDDYVDKYVGAEWLKPEVSSNIQIKHLLTHTSGLGDYFKDAYSQNIISVFRELSDYKTLIADDELAFKPGTQFSYSNSGMLILGVIIEKVSGKSYFDYLDEFIFTPAGMYNTGGFYKDRPVGNRAIGYTKIYENDEVTYDNHQFTRVLRGSPSGGVYSTVEDLLNFDIALRRNKLLSSENTKLLFKGRPELNAGFHSYGFFIEAGNAGKIATHKGDGSGVNAQFNMYLDKGYTFVVLSNYSSPSAKIVADIISGLINNLE